MNFLQYTTKRQLVEEAFDSRLQLKHFGGFSGKGKTSDMITLSDNIIKGVNLFKAGKGSGNPAFIFDENESVIDAFKTYKEMLSSGIDRVQANDVLYKTIKDDNGKFVKFDSSIGPIAVNEISTSALSDETTKVDKKSIQRVLTPMQEDLTLQFLLNQLNHNPTMTKEEAQAYIVRMHPNAFKHYSNVYYESAIKQTIEFNKYISGKVKNTKPKITGTYVGELQGEGVSKLFYNNKAVKNIKGLRADDWNPGDIWIFRKGIESEIKKVCAEAITYQEVNDFIKEGLINGSIIPISLKMIIKGNGMIESNNIVSTAVVEPLDNFSVEKVDAAKDSFKNMLLYLTGNYYFRFSFRASTIATTMSIEPGYKSSKSVKLGNTSKKRVMGYIEDNYDSYYKLIHDGKDNPKKHKKLIEKARKQLKYIKKKIKTDMVIPDGDLPTDPKGELPNDIYRQRLINIVSWLYVMTVKIKGEEQQDLFRTFVGWGKKNHRESSAFLKITYKHQ